MKKMTIRNIDINVTMKNLNVSIPQMCGNTDTTSKGFKAFTTFVRKYNEATHTDAEEITRINKAIASRRETIETAGEETVKLLTEEIETLVSKREKLTAKTARILADGNEKIPQYLYYAYCGNVHNHTAESSYNFRLAVAVWLFTVYGIKTMCGSELMHDIMLDSLNISENRTRTTLLNGMEFSPVGEKKFRDLLMGKFAEYFLTNGIIEKYDHSDFWAEFETKKTKSITTIK